MSQQRLSEDLFTTCFNAVTERLRLQTKTLRMIENHTREAIMDGNKTRSSHLGRDIFTLQRDTEVEEVLIAALQRIKDSFAALMRMGSHVVMVPVNLAPDLGIVTFAADVLSLPELTAFRDAVYFHLGLDPATAAPAAMPGWGLGPGESEIMKGILVPELLMRTYPPPFQPPTPEEAQKALVKLVDSFLAQAQAQRTLTATNRSAQFPAIPPGAQGSTIPLSLKETNFSNAEFGQPDVRPPSPTQKQFPAIPNRAAGGASLQGTNFSNADFEEQFSSPRGRQQMQFPTLPANRPPSPVARRPSPVSTGASLQGTNFSNADFEEQFSSPRGRQQMQFPTLPANRPPSPVARRPSPVTGDTLAVPPSNMRRSPSPQFPPIKPTASRPLDETNFSNSDFEETFGSSSAVPPLPPSPVDRRVPSPADRRVPSPSGSQGLLAPKPTNSSNRAPSPVRALPPKPAPAGPRKLPNPGAGQKLPGPTVPGQKLPGPTVPGQRAPNPSGRALPAKPRVTVSNNADSAMLSQMTETTKNRIADSVPPPPLTETMKNRIADSVPPPPLTETMKNRIADSVPPPPLTETMKNRIADSVPPPSAPPADASLAHVPPHCRRASEAVIPAKHTRAEMGGRAKSMEIISIPGMMKAGSATDALMMDSPKTPKKDKDKEKKEKKEKEKKEKEEKERKERERKEKEKKEKEKKKELDKSPSFIGKLRRKSFDGTPPMGDNSTRPASMSLQFCEPKNMPIEVSPLELTFGLASRQAPVDSMMEETLTIRNPQKYSILCAAENLTAEALARKAVLEFEPSGTFLISSNSTFCLKVKLTLLCTAKFHLIFGIKAWKTKSSPQVQMLKMTYSVESQLTTRLDPDEIKREDLIGKGSYGMVYSGRYRGMDVAVKVMRFQDCMTRGMREDFVKEIDMMEKLRHSAIVNFIGAVLIPGQMQIVTELCPYGAMLSAIRKHPKEFTMALKIKCLLDASNAMDFLHQSGIIHRDLKPDNLLMVSLQPRAAVACKLSDFGTTRDVNAFAQDMMRTEGVGTPLFMAPEILASKPYDRPVDVYSFSYIIYTAYAEELPFENDKVAATPWGFADAIRSGMRPAVPRNCPPEVARLMVLCWDPNPEKRPTFEVIHKFFRSYFEDCFMDKPS